MNANDVINIDPTVHDGSAPAKQPKSTKAAISAIAATTTTIPSINESCFSCVQLRAILSEKEDFINKMIPKLNAAKALLKKQREGKLKTDRGQRCEDEKELILAMRTCKKKHSYKGIGTLYGVCDQTIIRMFQEGGSLYGRLDEEEPA